MEITAKDLSRLIELSKKKAELEFKKNVFGEDTTLGSEALQCLLLRVHRVGHIDGEHELDVGAGAGARGCRAGPAASRRRLRQWLLERACPAPDLVLLLDAPGETLFARKKEHSPARLEEQRQGFLALRDRLPNLVVLDASRDPDDVRRQALAAIWKRQAARLAGKTGGEDRA